MSEATRLRANLKALADAYCAATGQRLATVSDKLGHKWDFLTRIAAGEDVDFRISSYDADLDWFRANWPKGADWPKGVPRRAS